MRGSAALFECIVLSCVCVCACVFKCVMKCVYVCSSIQLIPSLYNVWKYILFFRSMYLHFYSSFYSILKLFYKITMHKNQLWLLFCECKTFWGATWGGCYTVWLHLCIMQMTHKCVCVRIDVIRHTHSRITKRALHFWHFGNVCIIQITNNKHFMLMMVGSSTTICSQPHWQYGATLCWRCTVYSVWPLLTSSPGSYESPVSSGPVLYCSCVR